MQNQERLSTVLSGVRVEANAARHADLGRGEPELRYATDADGEAVLLRSWPATNTEADLELQPFWRLELRALKKLASHLAQDIPLLLMHAGGSDATGFHLLCRTSGLCLLPHLSSHLPFEDEPEQRRAWCWRNLARIAHALNALHLQGFVHRNLNKWSVLTRATVDVDFVLTGYEWSSRILHQSDGSAVTVDAVMAEHTLTRDWKDFGRLAAELLQIDIARLCDPRIASARVAQGVDRAEVEFLRKIQDSTNIDPARLIHRIESLATVLGFQVTDRATQLFIFMPLGEDNRLTAEILKAAGGKISLRDVETQRRFVEQDLGSNAVAIAAPSRQSGDGFELILRGPKLQYSRIRDFVGAGGVESGWQMAYCRNAAAVVTASQPVFRQFPLDGFTVRVVVRNDPLRSDIGKASGAWSSVLQRLQPPPQSVVPSEDVTEGLLLAQVVQQSVAVNGEFPVELVPAPRGLPALRHGKHYLCVRPRADADREELSELLQEGRRLHTRLHDALADESEFVSDAWHLVQDIDYHEPGDQNTPWEFLKFTPDASGYTYIFVSDRAAPRYQHGILVSADAAGSRKQFERQMKAWRALLEDEELLRALANLASVVNQHAFPLVEDDGFRDLDGPKQRALRMLLNTQPLGIVQGPPGVGKTRLVGEMAGQVLNVDKDARLVFSAQSHAAVDHLLRGVHKKIKSMPNADPLIIRCRAQDSKHPPTDFDITRQVRQLAAAMVDSALLKEAPRDLREQVRLLADPKASRDHTPHADAAWTAGRFTHNPMEDLLIRSANFLFGTSNSGALARLLEERALFDWVVIEEAAKGTGSELLTPLLLSDRRAMIGDHHQLPPFGADQLAKLLENPAKVQKLLEIVDRVGARRFRDADTRELLRTLGRNGHEVSSAEFQRICAAAKLHLNLFESLITPAIRDGAGGQASYARVLTLQHRMHPDIADVVSHAFYADELDSADRCKKAYRCGTPPVRSAELPDAPIIWINMPWDQDTIGQAGSERRPGPFNLSEVHTALRVVRALEPARGDRGESPELALLSPYRAQVRELRTAVRRDELLRQHLRQFDRVGGEYIHTVDSFQGQEADVVIVSLVRNNARQSLRGALGFLADRRRMNVLFSRAKWRLIIIGCKTFLETVAARRFATPEEKENVRFLRLLLEAISRAEKNGSCVIANDFKSSDRQSKAAR